MLEVTKVIVLPLLHPSRYFAPPLPSLPCLALLHTSNVDCHETVTRGWCGTLSHTLSRSFALSLFVSHSLSLSFSLSFALSHTLALSLSPSLSHTLPLSLSHTRIHSLSHTRTLTREKVVH